MGTRTTSITKWLGAMALAGCLLLTGCAGSGSTSQSAPSAPQSDDEAVLESILANFEQLAAIPRPSHHEEEVGAFLLQWAQDKQFDAYRDEIGNLIFDVPATQGHEQAPPVVLQAHMDMVAVSDNPDFDPLTTPVETVRTEKTLATEGTSLGADDGIGIAVIMQYVSSDASHGPLRVIITVAEEDGTEGVNALDAATVENATYLINLDCEVANEANISSAAAIPTTVTQDSLRRSPSFDSAITIELAGMLGGHSGVMIDSGRINAIRATGDLLLAIEQEGIAYELSSLEGGAAMNAIPDTSSALLAVDSADIPRIKQIADEFATKLAKDYQATDPDVTVSVSEASLPQTVFETEQQESIMTFVMELPNGVYAMSQTIDGLVETSSNLGLMQADEGTVSMQMLPRGSVESSLDSLCLEQKQLAEHYGFAIEQSRTSEPWPPNPDSTLQPLVQEAYREVTGEEMELTSVHAGLECDTFAMLNPSLDMIAIGPQIDDAHTVDETLHLDSVVPLYRTLETTLASLGEKQD